MCISYWSSYVCSSDLQPIERQIFELVFQGLKVGRHRRDLRHRRVGADEAHWRAGQEIDLDRELPGHEALGAQLRPQPLPDQLLRQRLLRCRTASIRDPAAIEL